MVTDAPEGWVLMLTVLGPLLRIDAQPPAARQAPVMANVDRIFFMVLLGKFAARHETYPRPAPDFASGADGFMFVHNRHMNLAERLQKII